MPVLRLLILILVILSCITEICYVFRNQSFLIGLLNLVVVWAAFELTSRKVVKYLKNRKGHNERVNDQ